MASPISGIHAEPMGMICGVLRQSTAFKFGARRLEIYFAQVSVDCASRDGNRIRFVQEAWDRRAA